MPTLNWIGKEKVVNHHLDVPFRTLEKKYTFASEGQNDGGNMIIHGDNLDALKALLPKYEGRVKCIYIDPPYNTGNEGWVYNDNVNDPRIRKWLGEVVGKEGEDLSRHDKWLCMMYPRLKLLHKLLADDGVIFISISDIEIAHLRLLCDEIFGVSNFIANIIWENNYSPRNDAKGVAYVTDNVLVYSKYPGWSPKKRKRTENMDARYATPDNDPIPWTSSPAHAPSARTHKGMVYAIQHLYTGEFFYPPVGRCWAQEQAKMLANMCEWTDYELCSLPDKETRAQICGEPDLSQMPDVKAIVLKQTVEESRKLVEKKILKGNWPVFYFTNGGKGGLRVKKYLNDMGGKVLTTLWPYEDAGTNTEAKNELKKIFNGDVPLDTPKPVRLIEQVLGTFHDNNLIILDSFAGSGTTAHAVLNMNKQDGGHRKFILVEMMDYADTITAERVKRVISGYGADKRAVPGTGGGFSYYELGEPLLIDGLLNPNVPEAKIREYVYYTETRQPLPEASPNEKHLLGIHDRHAYYFYYEPEQLTTLNKAFLRTIQTPAESYLIYADVNALSAEEMEKFHITFKKIPRDIALL